jgi:hypothetical protein
MRYRSGLKRLSLSSVLVQGKVVANVLCLSGSVVMLRYAIALQTIVAMAALLTPVAQAAFSDKLSTVQAIRAC